MKSVQEWEAEVLRLLDVAEKEALSAVAERDATIATLTKQRDDLREWKSITEVECAVMLGYAMHPGDSVYQAMAGANQEASYMRGEIERATARAEAAERERDAAITAREAAEADTDRLDALRDNSWSLIPFDMPTGQGDADIGWAVTEVHAGKAEAVQVGIAYKDDPRAAVDAARAHATDAGGAA